MVAMSAATMGRNRTGERMAGYREKSGEPVTVVDGGKRADVGTVKSIYCMYWLHHYRVRDKHKAHVSWAGGDHVKFFSSVAW